jgi:hypothetical protein
MRRTGAFALALVITAMLAAPPAHAADPTFPIGSRLGLVPPPGMIASDAFPGFHATDEDAAILLTTLPAAAYAQIEKTFDPQALRKQGVEVEKRESMDLNGGKGFLLIGHQVAEKARFRKWLLIATMGDLTALVTAQIPEQDKTYSDSAIKDALATLSVRATVPEKEELALLPFTVGELAGFHVAEVVRGRVLVLIDKAADGAKASAPSNNDHVDAHFLVAVIPGGPAESDDRANFARLAFNEIAGIKDVHITMSEPLRLGGQSGFQTMADAKDARSGADVKVVQWLRFGGGGFLQMIGLSPVDTWIGTLARMRTVRDSITPK